MYRNIATEFWTDSKVEQLSCNEKLLMLYLLTATHGNLAGCFEVTFRRIEVETGIDMAHAEYAMSTLCDMGIVAYSPETNEVLICNWPKYNWSRSPKTKSALDKQITRIRNLDMKERLAREYEAQFGIPYQYPIDTVSNGIEEVSIPPVSVSVSDSAGDRVKGKGSLKPHFSKPTPEQVSAYASEKGNPDFNAEKFVDYYESNGWKVGKNPMRDWKAAVRGWIARDGGNPRKAVGRYAKYD